MQSSDTQVISYTVSISLERLRNFLLAGAISVFGFAAVMLAVRGVCQIPLGVTLVEASRLEHVTWLAIYLVVFVFGWGMTTTGVLMTAVQPKLNAFTGRGWQKLDRVANTGFGILGALPSLWFVSLLEGAPDPSWGPALTPLFAGVHAGLATAPWLAGTFIVVALGYVASAPARGDARA